MRNYFLFLVIFVSIKIENLYTYSEITFSSTLAPATVNQCFSFYGGSFINLSSYDNAFHHFTEVGPKYSDLSSMSKEEILALVDWHLLNDSAGGYAVPPVRNHVETVDAKGSRKLLTWIGDFQKNNQPSEFEIKNNIGKLLKYLKEKPLKERLKQWPSSFRERWEHISDQEIFENFIELAVADGLTSAFRRQGLLRDESKMENFRRVLERNSSIISTALGLAFSVPAIAHGFFPPYLPDINIAKNTLNSPELLNSVKENGLSKSLSLVREKLGSKDNWKFRVQFAARTYSMIATILLAVHIPSEIKNTEHQIGTQAGQQIVKAVEKLASGPNTPQAIAENQFNRYIASLKASGLNPDPGSPELQQVRQMFLSAYNK